MWFFICVLFILFSNLKCKKGYRKSEKKQLQVEKKRLQRQAIEIIYTKLAFIWAFGCSRPGTHSVFEGEEETLKYTLWNTRLVKFSELQSRSQVIRKARIEKKCIHFFSVGLHMDTHHLLLERRTEKKETIVQIEFITPAHQNLKEPCETIKWLCPLFTLPININSFTNGKRKSAPALVCHIKIPKFVSQKITTFSTN